MFQFSVVNYKTIQGKSRLLWLRVTQGIYVCLVVVIGLQTHGIQSYYSKQKTLIFHLCYGIHIKILPYYQMMMVG
jgi:hypothetical protein